MQFAFVKLIPLALPLFQAITIGVLKDALASSPAQIIHPHSPPPIKVSRSTPDPSTNTDEDMNTARYLYTTDGPLDMRLTIYTCFILSLVPALVRDITVYHLRSPLMDDSERTKRFDDCVDACTVILYFTLWFAVFELWIYLYKMSQAALSKMSSPASGQVGNIVLGFVGGLTTYALGLYLSGDLGALSDEGMPEKA